MAITNADIDNILRRAAVVLASRGTDPKARELAGSSQWLATEVAGLAAEVEVANAALVEARAEAQAARAEAELAAEQSDALNAELAEVRLALEECEGRPIPERG